MSKKATFIPQARPACLRQGEPVINDVGLAALALLVAESSPKDKDVMIRLVTTTHGLDQ